MLQQAPTRELARGRWAGILQSLGLQPEILSGKHCACPMCGGKDRFRFDNKDGLGTYFCSQCGAGDGFMLASRFSGKPFKEVAALVQATFHTLKPMAQDKRDEVAQQRAIRNAWEASWQPSPMSRVGMYHTARFGRPWASKSIRENYSGMVALIHDKDDKPVNVHLTALTREGQKNETVGVVKKVMPGKLPEGCAIRIWDAAPVMGIAEGIETAISAAILFKMPVWAAVNGSLLSKWIPPEVAETIWIFGDNDVNYTGQSKAYALANRLSVQFERKVEIKIPDQIGQDWNDVLRNQNNGSNSII